MKNGPECLPCCLRRVLRCCDQVTTDDWIQRKVLAEAMGELARCDDQATPAEIVFGAVSRAGKTLGDSDPYAEEKRRWLDESLGNEEELRSLILGSTDPLLFATRLAAETNLLDCEFREEICRDFSLKNLIHRLESGGLEMQTEVFEDFREAIESAKSILFVHDTAAELVFDRLLIETFARPKSVITSVVREGAILAHATHGDAEIARLDSVSASIIDPGSACLGVPLAAASPVFREAFESADLVIAKGQAAYQTLEGSVARESEAPDRSVFFLLRVKCGLMARQLGVQIGDSVLDLD